MFNKVLLTCFIKNINININSLLSLVYQNRLSSISSFCTVRVYLYTYFKTTAIFITKTLSTRRFSGWVAECLCMYVYNRTTQGTRRGGRRGGGSVRKDNKNTRTFPFPSLQLCYPVLIPSTFALISSRNLSSRA